LQLLARIAQDLAVPDAEPRDRSIMELHGLGAEIWQGIDASSMSTSCAMSGIGSDEARRRAGGSRSPRVRYRAGDLFRRGAPALRRVSH
jgi:hypothetical protein